MFTIKNIFSGKKTADKSSHWDKAYERNDFKKLGWYEETPEPSLSLIEKYVPEKKSSILNVGAGTTTLIDFLLEKGYSEIKVNDISNSAIKLLKERCSDKGSEVKWIIDDIVNPSELDKLDPVDLWHDRAVLHFFNTEEEQEKYFSLVKSIVKKGGYVMISVFSPGGAVKCSGLKITPYTADQIGEQLGRDFIKIEDFDYLYTMPSGETRDYIYTVFRRR